MPNYRPHSLQTRVHLLFVPVLQNEFFKRESHLLVRHSNELVETHGVVGIVAGVAWGVEFAWFSTFARVDEVALGICGWCSRNCIICMKITSSCFTWQKRNLPPPCPACTAGPCFTSRCAHLSRSWLRISLFAVFVRDILQKTHFRFRHQDKPSSYQKTGFRKIVAEMPDVYITCYKIVLSPEAPSGVMAVRVEDDEQARVAGRQWRRHVVAAQLLVGRRLADVLALLVRV